MDVFSDVKIGGSKRTLQLTEFDAVSDNLTSITAIPDCSDTTITANSVEIEASETSPESIIRSKFKRPKSSIEEFFDFVKIDSHRNKTYNCKFCGHRLSGSSLRLHSHILGQAVGDQRIRKCTAPSEAALTVSRNYISQMNNSYEPIEEEELLEVQTPKHILIPQVEKKRVTPSKKEVHFDEELNQATSGIASHFILIKRDSHGNRTYSCPSCPFTVTGTLKKLASHVLGEKVGDQNVKKCPSPTEAAVLEAQFYLSGMKSRSRSSTSYSSSSLAAAAAARKGVKNSNGHGKAAAKVVAVRATRSSAGQAKQDDASADIVDSDDMKSVSDNTAEELPEEDEESIKDIKDKVEKMEASSSARAAAAVVDHKGNSSDTESIPVDANPVVLEEEREGAAGPDPEIQSFFTLSHKPNKRSVCRFVCKSCDQMIADDVQRLYAHVLGEPVGGKTAIKCSNPPQQAVAIAKKYSLQIQKQNNKELINGKEKPQQKLK